jgi:superfamily II DNA or RNA helicase
MSVRTILYLWEDIRSPGDMKFGDHTIDGNPTQSEIELDTKAYIRREMQRQKYIYDQGKILVHWIIDVTEYAEKVGRNRKGAKLDTFIANEKTNLKLHRISKNGGDFYQIDKDELTRQVNEAVYGSAKLGTHSPHTYQQIAIDKAVNYFGAGNTDFLLDCVMRFGKSFSSYQIAKGIKAKRILVVTGRPKVKNGWKDDLDHVDFAGWDFIDSQVVNNAAFYEGGNSLFEMNEPAAEVIFASFQGGKRADSRIAKVIEQDIDLIIIDEAHAYFSTDAIDFVNKLTAKHKLWVSGTPFKAYESGMFDGETDTYRFTLLDLLREKSRVEAAIKAGEVVTSTEMRYTEFPNVQFLVAEYPQFDANELYKEESLNMKALLSSKDGVANYPDEVNGILDSLLRTDNRSPFNMGGREIKYPVDAKHVWMAVPAGKDDTSDLPVAAASTLETAISQHHVFSELFEPLAIKGNKDQDDVNRHITLAKQNGKGSINISCRSLNTGTKFPDINTVVFLNETASASEFWQTVGRALQPQPGKKHITIICYSVEMVVNMANRMVEYSVKDGDTHNKIMTEFLTMMPIFINNGPKVNALDIEEVYQQLSSSGSVTKSFGDREVLSKEFDNIVLNNLAFFQDIPDVTSDKAPASQILHSSGVKGKNTLKKRVTPLTPTEKNVVAEIRMKIREFLKQTGSVMAASLLYDEYLITSSNDLKGIKTSTIDSELYPGTKVILTTLLDSGALNTPILDKKISAFYNVALKGKISNE